MGIVRDLVKDAIIEPPARSSIIEPFMLSHGTLECFNLNETRRFYTDFLGLETVRHAPIGMAVRLGLKFHVICLEVGNTLSPATLGNHWGLDVESTELVDIAHRKVLQYKDQFKIGEISSPTMQHGAYSFYFEDLDHNWWEIQHIPNFLHDDLFDFGDVFDSEGRPFTS